MKEKLLSTWSAAWTLAATCLLAAFALPNAVVSAFASSAAFAPATVALDAADVLARSIAYHDPERRWAHSSWRLQLRSTRPIAGPTETSIVIDNVAGRFHMERDRFGNVTETTVTGDECWTRLNGSSEITEEQTRRFSLDCEAMKRMRNYHIFLYGLPMKLTDPGTRLDPEARETSFQDQDVLALKVTYDEEVGTDIWDFYFDPSTYALVGYGFVQTDGDKEYVVLVREAQGDGVRLPKVRTWFDVNADDRLLGTDTIVSIERISR